VCLRFAVSSEILGKSATLITHCPGSGAELVVDLAPGEVRATDPFNSVMSIVAPDSKSCCDNLRKAYCEHVNLFKDEQTFSAWAQDRPDVGCVTLRDAQLYARRRNTLRGPPMSTWRVIAELVANKRCHDAGGRREFDHAAISQNCVRRREFAA
jgi:hypothetical protein